MQTMKIIPYNTIRAVTHQVELIYINIHVYVNPYINDPIPLWLDLLCFIGTRCGWICKLSGLLEFLAVLPLRQKKYHSEKNGLLLWNIISLAEIIIAALKYILSLRNMDCPSEKNCLPAPKYILPLQNMDCHSEKKLFAAPKYYWPLRNYALPLRKKPSSNPEILHTHRQRTYKAQN